MPNDTMRAAVVPSADGGLELRERPVPDPGPGEVRVRVEACGVCRGDDLVVDGTQSVDYPRVPGHELVGTVDAAGRAVTEWAVGDRVGVGWHGGHCLACDACRHGEFVHCAEKPITGVHRDGGYAEYALARPEALAAVPSALDAVDAAPLLCAGLTTFNALRNAALAPGDVVAVLGIGGLGHLGVQYAHEAGFQTVAISRGDGKHEAARDLGADHYVDTDATDPGEALQALGGADLVLSTAPAADAVADVVDGIGPDGEVCSVGVPDDPVPVDVGHLTATRGRVSGWASGTPIDAEETLAFSDRRDVRPAVETYALADAPTAYRHMTQGDVRFRAVITP